VEIWHYISNLGEMNQIYGVCAIFQLWRNLEFGLNRGGYSCDLGD